MKESTSPKGGAYVAADRVVLRTMYVYVQNAKSLQGEYRFAYSDDETGPPQAMDYFQPSMWSITRSSTSVAAAILASTGTYRPTICEKRKKSHTLLIEERSEKTCA